MKKTLKEGSGAAGEKPWGGGKAHNSPILLERPPDRSSIWRRKGTQIKEGGREKFVCPSTNCWPCLLSAAGKTLLKRPDIQRIRRSPREVSESGALLFPGGGVFHTAEKSVLNRLRSKSASSNGSERTWNSIPFRGGRAQGEESIGDTIKPTGS